LISDKCISASGGTVVNVFSQNKDEHFKSVYGYILLKRVTLFTLF